MCECVCCYRSSKRPLREGEKAGGSKKGGKEGGRQGDKGKRPRHSGAPEAKRKRHKTK